jgi:hypothetical protein
LILVLGIAMLGSHPLKRWTIESVLISLGALLIYFFPSIAGHKKRSAAAILMVNFLLGWTVIGWVLTLAWAVTKDKNQV